MSNHITSVKIQNVSVDPLSADLEIAIETDSPSESTEIRGRLMGPSCLYSNTVEIAYPLKRRDDSYQVIIPEPSYWDPQTPFLYHGPIELWESGQRVERKQISHGIRSFSLTENGLILNGHDLELRGVERDSLDETALISLREQGYNLLLIPLEKSNVPLWETASRIGFFVLGEVGDSSLIEECSAQPSCLGWVSETAVPGIWGRRIEDGVSSDCHFAVVRERNPNFSFPQIVIEKESE